LEHVEGAAAAREDQEGLGLGLSAVPAGQAHRLLGQLHLQRVSVVVRGGPQDPQQHPHVDVEADQVEVPAYAFIRLLFEKDLLHAVVTVGGKKNRCIRLQYHARRRHIPHR